MTHDTSHDVTRFECAPVRLTFSRYVASILSFTVHHFIRPLATMAGPTHEHELSGRGGARTRSQ
jgi:predicted O-linked N-acetylglucosamine transferase (SPINDLY family)